MSTVSVDNPDLLRGILANAQALLLDFDGPVCDLFAGVGDHHVAELLRGVLAEQGHSNLPDEVAQSADPFEILRYAATLGAEEAGRVEDALTACESEAVETAAATPGGHELLAAWHTTGRPLAVVSNNAPATVNAYLDRHYLRRFVTHIAARSATDPAQLKPSPYPLKQAARALGISPSHCTLIGDSTADMVAAIRAACATIAYAQDAESATAFSQVYPDAITTSIEALIPDVRAIAARRQNGR